MITQVGNTGSSSGTVGGYNGDGELNTSALLSGPAGIDMDAANYIYIAEQGSNIIRKTLLTGLTPNPISTVAGTVPPSYTGTTPPIGGGYVGDGGPATSAQLSGPSGVRVDAAGDIYISDQYNQVIREVNAATRFISTIAGDTTTTTASGAPGGYNGDGIPATSAQLNFPYGIGLDEKGNLYIADYENFAIRKVDVSDPPSLRTFANTLIGSTSAEQDVTLLNLGTGPLNISKPTGNFSLGGTNATCSTSTPLASATSCVLGIEFTPTTTGLLSGSEAISATQTIALSGNGSGGTGNQSQTISFSNPGAQSYGTPLTLAATASSGLPVSYSVTGPATVNGSTLTFTGTGSVTVKATQAGNSSYSAASPVSQTFTVNAEAESYKLSNTGSSALSMSNSSSQQVNLMLSSTTFTGTVTISTKVTTNDGTASAVTATPSPAKVTLSAGGSAQPCTITIATTTSASKHAPFTPWKTGGAVMLCAVLLGAPFTLRRKHAIAVLLMASAITLAGFFLACGGGSSSKSTSPTSGARTYTVTVTAKGTSSGGALATVTDATPMSFTVTVQ